MPFQAVCSCPWHDEWKHGKVTSQQLRSCTREETSFFSLNAEDTKSKGRKRKVCISCRSRLEVEAKCQKLEEICARQCHDDITIHIPEGEANADHCDESESLLETAPVQLVGVLDSSSKEHGSNTCDKGTQNPLLPQVPYKDMAERRQRLIRADITELIRASAMKMVHFVPGDLTLFMEELLQNKKFCSTFGLSLDNKDITCNPTIQALVKEYQSSVDKEKKQEVRRRASNQKSKVCIGNSLKNSRVTLTGEKTPEHFKDRVTAASSLGRLTCYADERRRLLSIVAFDYPYSVLQELFNCSSKTVAAAKVHCILFGRGGTPPAQFKFKRQCVSPDVLMELSEFFQRDSVSRPSSCRSVVVDGQETPIRYWKDSVKELVNQYLLEYPNGVKRTYIYTHLPSYFRYNTMLAGLCNLCDEFGYSNFEKFSSFLANVETATNVSMKEMRTKVLQHQRYMNTQFTKQAERHSPCLELCMNNAFGSCTQPHDRVCPEASRLFDVGKDLQELLLNVAGVSERESLTKELDSLMNIYTQYAAHLLRTKHQGEYYKFIQDNLQPGEAIVIIDYKMKLELGVRTREIQRDWYGKRGISLHGFLIIAQVSESERRTEVIDLWSEDTKQDAWFSQSAMDVGFKWMAKEFPGVRVYLFSDNGPHYHNTGFILYLAEVSKAFGLTLVEYNNFEAGEGKSKLDTHFAHISHKIVRWVRVGNNLETGSQLGELIGSMKNVTCKKLLIDRSKAPDKLGTLKDISLYGSFEFPTAGQHSGGLIARSLAGIGKELKKTQQQLRSLSNRSLPIAGATGAVTCEEIPISPVNFGNESSRQELYSVRFIQHEDHGPERNTNTTEMSGDDSLKTNLLKPGFALKTGGAKRTVFSLEQKEVMIEFYNRQANCGIRADPKECISAMRERGLEVLKESQIKSWWSTYHQKRKREMERMATDFHNILETVSSNSSLPLTTSQQVSNSAFPIQEPTQTSTCNPSAPSTTSRQASSSNSASVVQAAPSSSDPSPPSATSQQASSSNSASVDTAAPPSSNFSAPSPMSKQAPSIPSATVPVTVSTASSLNGTDVGFGMTEWSFAMNVSQSTIDNRNGSNACTFIALSFGYIYQQYNLTTPVGQHLDGQWQTALVDAIRTGNDLHDELFDGHGINIAVDDAIATVGDQCHVHGILQDHNVFGVNPLDQFTKIIDLILQQKQSFHVLVVNDMTTLIIVDCNGTLMFIDSHVHGRKGAIIARSVPYLGQQGQRFSAWFNGMLMASRGVGLSVCSLSTISYF